MAVMSPSKKKCCSTKVSYPKGMLIKGHSFLKEHAAPDGFDIPKAHSMVY